MSVLLPEWTVGILVLWFTFVYLSWVYHWLQKSVGEIHKSSKPIRENWNVKWSGDKDVYFHMLQVLSEISIHWQHTAVARKCWITTDNHHANQFYHIVPLLGHVWNFISYILSVHYHFVYFIFPLLTYESFLLCGHYWFIPWCSSLSCLPPRNCLLVFFNLSTVSFQVFLVYGSPLYIITTSFCTSSVHPSHTPLCSTHHLIRHYIFLPYMHL